MPTGLRWGGSAVAVEWQWSGSGVAIGWQWGGKRMAMGWQHGVRIKTAAPSRSPPCAHAMQCALSPWTLCFCPTAPSRRVEVVAEDLAVPGVADGRLAVPGGAQRRRQGELVLAAEDDALLEDHLPALHEEVLLERQRPAGAWPLSRCARPAAHRPQDPPMV